MMPDARTALRISTVMVLCWVLMPYIFGGGWALVQFAYLGVYGARHPEAKKTLDSADKVEAQTYAKSLIEKGRKPSVVILSLAGFAFLGALYGLIARHWKSTLLVFLVTLLRGNPALFRVPMSLFERALIMLFCQLLVSYFSSYVFSRIGIKSSETRESSAQAP